MGSTYCGSTYRLQATVPVWGFLGIILMFLRRSLNSLDNAVIWYRRAFPTLLLMDFWARLFKRGFRLPLRLLCRHRLRFTALSLGIQ